MIHSLTDVSALQVLESVELQRAEHAMAGLGKQIAEACNEGAVLYLEGTLGMGKTTLSRAIVQGAGWSGSVKSPTYTLIETYEVDGRTLYHLDLYRLADPEELEFMGLRDMLTQGAIWLIEWPERGRGGLPAADWQVTLSDGTEPKTRAIGFEALTPNGEYCLQRLKELQS